MRRHPTQVLGILLTASLGLLAGTYLWLGAAQTPAPARSPGRDPGLIAHAGPSPATHDSAAPFVRSGDNRDDHSDDAPASRPPRPGQGTPQPPPAPAPPDAATLAAQDVFFVLRDRVSAEAQRGLDSERTSLRRACWRPELADGATSASFRVTASFDAAGSLTALGISEPPDGAAAGVATCLRQRVLGLQVAPPGTGLHVDLALQLP